MDTGVVSVLLFLDTEYTGLGQRDPKLISLAIVNEDGRLEFYAELADTWRVDDCSEFVKREVLPLLNGPGRLSAEVRDELRTWFMNAPSHVQTACDSATDWGFLLDLLGTPHPSNLTEKYLDLRPLIDTTIYDRTVSAYYQVDNRMHHALVDARAYRRGWLAWMDARKAKTN